MSFARDEGGLRLLLQGGVCSWETAKQPSGGHPAMRTGFDFTRSADGAKEEVMMMTNESGDPVIGTYDHGAALGILAASRSASIRAVAERVLDDLGEVSVITNRTGLAMVPYHDTVKGTAFHLGEVLVAEAHIEVPGLGVEGYGAVIGRDLEHAMAMAVIDAAIAARQSIAPIIELLDAERAHQEMVDRERLRQVEATRVHMETF